MVSTTVQAASQLSKKGRIHWYICSVALAALGNTRLNLHSDAFDTIVQVLVGPDKISFNMHKGLLCNVAPYFEAALKGSFLESSAQVLELIEDDPVMFERFQLWTYTNRLLEDGETDKEIPFIVWADLWVFGEARGIPELQNCAIDGLINDEITTNYVPIGIFQHVYDNTHEDSPLRRLILDWAAFSGCWNRAADYGWFIKSRRGYYPKDFLFD